MAQARAENRARFRPYIVTRDYKLFGKERDKTKSRVIADVAFVPPDSKKYAIQQTNGSGLGGIIVRRMLASEAEVTKDYALTDFSPDNYGFRFIREEEVSGRRWYVLELLPRRKDTHLLRGDVWVDANTYLLRRIEGQPAKTPSFGGCGTCALRLSTARLGECGCRQPRKRRPISGFSGAPRSFHGM